MNYNYYNTDPAILRDYAEQYESMGRETLIDGDKLTVFSGKRPVLDTGSKRRVEYKDRRRKEQ